MRAGRTAAGVDADAVLAELATGAPLETVRKEHAAAVANSEVWGGPTFVAGDTGNAARPDIAKIPEGITGAQQFVVAFQDPAHGIYFRLYSDNGVAVHDRPQLIAGSANSFAPKVTGLKDGGFIVAWVDQTGIEGDGTAELKICLQRFDAQGGAEGAKLEIDLPGGQRRLSPRAAKGIAHAAAGRVDVT